MPLPRAHIQHVLVGKDHAVVSGPAEHAGFIGLVAFLVAGKVRALAFQ